MVARAHWRGAAAAHFGRASAMTEDELKAIEARDADDADLLFEDPDVVNDRFALACVDRHALVAEVRAVRVALEEERALRTQAQASLNTIAFAGADGVWFWQGKSDPSELLTCPVVMSADTLREILARGSAGLCAFCGGAVSSDYGIHRDGLGEGPELPLCTDCGSHEKPTCEEIWARISTKGQAR